MANGPFYSVGLHVAEVVAQGLTKTGTGKPQFVLKTKILGVPDESGSYLAHQQQYERSVYMVLTEKTVPFVTGNLEKLGFPKDASLYSLDPSSQGFHDFKGQQVELWCKHETDQQGAVRERWQISNGGGGGIVGDPLDQREMRQLDALFGRGRTAVPPAARTAPPARQPDYGDQGITDDDIPF